MKLTIDQTKSFIQDNTSIADTTGINLVEQKFKRIAQDEHDYILVVEIGGIFYKGKVHYYHEPDDKYWNVNFFDGFDGLELKECTKVEKITYEWKEV